MYKLMWYIHTPQYYSAIKKGQTTANHTHTYTHWISRALFSLKEQTRRSAYLWVPFIWNSKRTYLTYSNKADPKLPGVRMVKRSTSGTGYRIFRAHCKMKTGDPSFKEFQGSSSRAIKRPLSTSPHVRTRVVHSRNQPQRLGADQWLQKTTVICCPLHPRIWKLSPVFPDGNNLSVLIPHLRHEPPLQHACHGVARLCFSTFSDEELTTPQHSHSFFNGSDRRWGLHPLLPVPRFLLLWEVIHICEEDSRTPPRVSLSYLTTYMGDPSMAACSWHSLL